MSYIVQDCPRCGAQEMTFEVQKVFHFGTRYDWQKCYEVFSICRSCLKSTTFTIDQKNSADSFSEQGMENANIALNMYFDIKGYISLKNNIAIQPPDHLPDQIQSVFDEAATCLSLQCFNASGAMFRLCVDLATKDKLPEEETEGLTRRIRGNLAARLGWLFDARIIAPELRDLAQCIKDDGNDGAHDGSLVKEDAEDMRDFTYELLERIYTEPERLRLAQERRVQRRSQR